MTRELRCDVCGRDAWRGNDTHPWRVGRIYGERARPSRDHGCGSLPRGWVALGADRHLCGIGCAIACETEAPAGAGG